MINYLKKKAKYLENTRMFCLANLRKSSQNIKKYLNLITKNNIFQKLFFNYLYGFDQIRIKKF